MIPRYSNPHKILDYTKPITRAELYNAESDDDGPADFSAFETSLLSKKLREQLQVALGQHRAQGNDTYPLRKRRKLNADGEEPSGEQLRASLLQEHILYSV